MKRTYCHDRIKEVQQNYGTSRRAIALLVETARNQRQLLADHGLTLAEVRLILDQLHDLFFVRLFACFETFLRDYWRRGCRRSTKPATQQLLASIASRRGVPNDVLDTVQDIRRFRNSLIHEEDPDADPFSIDTAIGPLQTFLARLPLEW